MNNAIELLPLTFSTSKSHYDLMSETPVCKLLGSLAMLPSNAFSLSYKFFIHIKRTVSSSMNDGVLLLFEIEAILLLRFFYGCGFQFFVEQCAFKQQSSTPFCLRGVGGGWHSLILKPVLLLLPGSGDNLLKVAGSQVEDAQKWFKMFSQWQL